VLGLFGIIGTSVFLIIVIPV
jgi:hypothetical protein